MKTTRVLTLGDLQATRHGITGHCRDCADKYEPTRHSNPPAMFDVDLPALIGEQGAKRWIADLAPPRCPNCGGYNTTFRIATPPR